MKLVWPIKMRLNETCEVCIGEHVSNSLHIQNGLKEDALWQRGFDFA
jgi:hypothetical protein